jgi:glycerol-3-phosphate acyltransferase PlsY
MSDLVVVELLIPVAYLLGTFPSAGIVARRSGVDVTAEGSRNPGASNTFRLLGWRAGTLVFGLDALKGALAALAGVLIDGHRGLYILGIAAILGHTLPVTRRFKGGRGVATAAGVLIVLFPLLTLAMSAMWGVIVCLTHKASLASVIVAICAPFAVAAAGHPWSDITPIAILGAIVVARHLSNLRRLVRGEELGFAHDEPEDPEAGDQRAAS